MSWDLVLQYSRHLSRFMARDLPWMCVTASLAVPVILFIVAVPYTAKVLYCWIW